MGDKACVYTIEFRSKSADTESASVAYSLRWWSYEEERNAAESNG